jgi:hypothetical protein
MADDVPKMSSYAYIHYTDMFSVYEHIPVV